MNYFVYKNLFESEPLPCAFVDLDALDFNIKNLLSQVGEFSGTIRIATKSIRVPKLIDYILSSNPKFKGLMCYSLQEAEFLASKGFDDFLVAYPSVDPRDIKTFQHLNNSGKLIRLVVDSLKGVREISNSTESSEHPARLIVEFDLALRFFGIHIGVRRSPIKDVGELVQFYKHMKEFPSIRFDGLMGYEAQVAGLPDRNPFKKWLSPVFHLIRELSAKTSSKKRKEIFSVFKEENFKIDVFNGGGTGSLSYASNEYWLTELTTGSGFLCPHLFDYYSNLNLKPACFFALRVARKPASNFLTCSGGGYIASGESGRDRAPIPYLPDDLELVKEEGCGEVQTPLFGKNADQLMIGDPVFFRHAKAGELAERFNEYIFIRNGKIVDRAKTYRGYGECYF